MAIVKYNPTSPGRRNMTVLDYAEITATKPEKSLTKGISSTGGRNNAGRITTRFRGGGNKRRYREIDFKRNKDGIPATVKTIEYDPNRTANIALLAYADGEKRYIVAPLGVTVGDVLMSGSKAEPKVGNTLKIKDIPAGLTIHNIEMNPGHGAKIARAAGQYATLRSKDGKFALIKMPSGEIRQLNPECRATIGQVGNLELMKVKVGKAGKTRYKGRRPHVRGVAMNPVDHPMGGGEGKTSGGGHPVSPWGQLAKGKRTRDKKKTSNRFIVERRKK